MNTSEYIPFHSVAPIILRNDDYPEYPFFSGTGFFVKFKPFQHIFFITGRHCIYDNENNPKGQLIIPLSFNSKSKKKIEFVENITTQIPNEPDLEDIAIYVVKNTAKQKEILQKRCLRLINQEDSDLLLQIALGNKTKVRTVGYPATDEKGIDYENQQASIQPRGFHGNVLEKSDDGRWYTVNNMNWKDNDKCISGFSGAPVLEFIPDPKGGIEAVPIGVLLTGSKDQMKFISITIITDLIAGYLKHR